MTIKIMYYFTVYTDKDPTTHESLHNLMKACDKKKAKLITIFRYKHRLLEQERFDRLTKEIMYNDRIFSKKLTEREISEAQEFIGVSFNMIRKMSSLAKLTNKLPDDQLLAKFVYSWKNIMEKHRPDVLFCGLMDDFAGNIGMFVARKMGIKVITIYAGGGIESVIKLCDLNYHQIFYKNLNKSHIDNAYKKAYDEWKKTVVRDKSIVSSLSWTYDIANPLNTIKLVKSFFSAIKTYYFEIPKIERKLWSSPFLIAKRQIRYFLSKSITKMLFRAKPKKEKYVLFAPNFMDDALMFTLMPDFNIKHFIKNLSNVLPTDTKLYIKPHPHWQNADLAISDLRYFKKLKNVVLLSPNENTRDLIENSQLVVVLNSSVVYDTMYMKKPVIMFGNILPESAVHIAKDYDETRSYRQIELEKWKRFIGNMYAHSYRQGNSSIYVKGGVDQRDSEEIVDRIIKSYKYLKKKDNQKIMVWPKIA